MNGVKWTLITNYNSGIEKLCTVICRFPDVDGTRFSLIKKVVNPHRFLHIIITSPQVN